ncbi:MAG: diguanylate cyclase [Epsilonproteobacteria bacterium]|nr:diguanylate cyclase [Campylobacterota bacterium]
MSCKELMERHRIDNVDEFKKVQEIAKLAINFITKNRIPLTPANFDEWFYVVCKAIEDKHVLSEKNLRILYKKYHEDFISELDIEKKEIEEISISLKDVTTESNQILDTFDANIDHHSELINESIDAIDQRDVQKIEDLKKRIQALEEENRKLRAYLERNRKKLELVEAKFHETKKEADIDALTQVYNRKRLEKDVEEFDLNCSTYSVIFIDIDNFKKINDNFGHSVGDRVLQEVGEILRHYLRRNTYAYRYGGEEFVVVIPEGSIEVARIIANRLRDVMENRTIKLDDHTIINFTASFGAAQRRGNESFEEVLKRADEALYEAKRSGKNRVVLK